MAGASSVFPNRLAPPLGMGYTTRRKQTAAPGEWPAGKGVFMRVLEQLEPQGVFRFFEELCAIPHGSRNCQAVSDWCAAFARERGLECHQDQAGNVIIIQEATPGYEAAAPVILQGHLDMVCEKEPGCTKDMAGEGLDLLVEDGCVRAKGTTLGGDDGIAVAMALAILVACSISLAAPVVTVSNTISSAARPPRYPTSIASSSFWVLRYFSSSGTCIT